MAAAFTGFIIAFKFNYCHGVSTEPGFRNCSDAINNILRGGNIATQNFLVL